MPQFSDSGQLRTPFPIHPKLPKNQQIQHQRPRTPNQPTRVQQYILSILLPVFSASTPSPVGVHAPHPRTTRLISEYTHHIRQIPHARKQEKKHANPLGTFAAVVQQQLGNAGAKVEDGAKVAEDLAPEVKVQRSRTFTCRWDVIDAVVVMTVTVMFVVGVLAPR